MKSRYGLISTYRKELMGIAIAMIMITHNTVDSSGVFHILNSGLQLLTQAGVDMFFFLSGYGCFYSMNKNPDTLLFYKRRVLRIIPPFLVVVLLYGIISVLFFAIPVTDYIWQYSLVSFYVADDLHEWFVAAILLIYLVYPLIYFWIKKKEIVAIIFICATYVVILMHIVGIIHFRPVLMDIFVTRVPAFLFGTLFAKRATEEKEIKHMVLILITIIGFLCSVIAMYLHHRRVRHSWTLIRTSYIFVLLAIIILWIAIREKTSRDNKIVGLLAQFLGYIGGFTLEIYLLHEKVLGVLSYFLPTNGFIALLILNILAIALSIVLADKLRTSASCLLMRN